MVRTRYAVFLAIAALVLTSNLFAQAVQGSPGLVTQKVISMDMAMTIAQGVVERCRADGYRVSVSVLDNSGEMKAFLRDEGTGPHTVDLSRRKAFTALTFANRWPKTGAGTKEWGTTIMSPMPNVEGTTGVGGGVAIKVGDVAVGAVGVSGAPGWQRDEACADAGITKVADKLK